MKNQNGNLLFESPPRIAGFAAAVGKKEGEGPLRDYFDCVMEDSYVGKETFEQAESELTSTAVRIALQKADFTADDIDLACCGDLLNQCVASSFAMRSYAIPYAGVYSACSTMALSMILSAVAAESGAVSRAVCAASSHYCTAERQYRFPLEYGSQRPPTAQWTVTAAGACVIEAQRQNSRPSHDTVLRENETGVSAPPAAGSYSASGSGADRPTPAALRIISARIGKIIDYDITDQNNMGAAMAPADVK